MVARSAACASSGPPIIADAPATHPKQRSPSLDEAVDNHLDQTASSTSTHPIAPIPAIHDVREYRSQASGQQQ
ncbi:hypothetical protein ACLOJK_024372 [Asimina triloba]